MILYVDKLKINDFGGFTHDLSKIDYNLKTIGLDKSILKDAPGQIPILVRDFGKYVMFYQFSRDFKKGIMGFINYQIDLVENFNTFADSLTPKSVEAFYENQEKIKLKDFQDLNSVELSDNSLLFQTLSQN